MTYTAQPCDSFDVELRRKQAEQLLTDAHGDPILDGLIGWYAAKAERVLDDAADLTADAIHTVAGTDPASMVYEQSTQDLAAAGILRGRHWRDMRRAESRPSAGLSHRCDTPNGQRDATIR